MSLNGYNQKIYRESSTFYINTTLINPIQNSHYWLIFSIYLVNFHGKGSGNEFFLDENISLNLQKMNKNDVTDQQNSGVMYYFWPPDENP